MMQFTFNNIDSFNKMSIICLHLLPLLKTPELVFHLSLIPIPQNSHIKTIKLWEIWLSGKSRDTGGPRRVKAQAERDKETTGWPLPITTAHTPKTSWQEVALACSPVCPVVLYARPSEPQPFPYCKWVRWPNMVQCAGKEMM